MATALDIYNGLKNDKLFHSGQLGMEWYKHKYGKWQTQAVYAQGRPNPDAKVRGQKEKSEKKVGKSSNQNGSKETKVFLGKPGQHRLTKKEIEAKKTYSSKRPNPNAKVRGQKEDSIRLPGFRRGLSSDELQREIDKKSTSELKEATNRLIAEKDYKNAVINNMKATRDYNDLLSSGSVNVGKKFMKGLKYFTKSDLGKLAWTGIKYKGYEMMREKHGDEAARTIFGTVLKFNDGGGKKNPKGGDEQQKDQDKDAQQQDQGKNKEKQQKNQNGGK